MNSRTEMSGGFGAWLSRMASALMVGIPMLAGCDETEPPDASVLVRDSAEVRIVEALGPGWAEGSEWRVEETATVTIGTVDGEQPYQLFQVRDAIRLEGGEIVVADLGSSEVRVFSPDGQYLRTVAGEGDGPGEVRFPSRVFAEGGDSILVVHSGGLSRFSVTGGFLESQPPPMLQPRARLADGSFLGLGFAAGVDPARLGQVREVLALVRFHARRPEADTLAVASGGEVYRVEAFGGIASIQVPFSSDILIAARDQDVVMGDGSDWDITILTRAGRPVEILRRPDGDRRVTASVMRVEEQRLLDQATSEDRRRLLRQVFSEWTSPNRWPAFDEIVVDSEGNIWAKHYGGQDGEGQSWSIFDRTGVWMGEVAVPESLRVTAIGPDYVLGVAVDELGVEYVQLHSLTK